MKKRTVQIKNKKQLVTLVAVALVLALVLGVYRMADPEGFAHVWQMITGEEISVGGSSNLPEDSSFAVHMLDVGIGDSLLVQCDGKNMLIDAAENNMGDEVLDYLAKVGVTKLDVAVGTHAHSDHIGGLDTVLAGIDCDEVYLSEIAKKATPTTKTYLNLLQVISDKKIPLKKAKAGDSFFLGSAKVEILGPVEVYDDLNETSIVLRVTYGETVFLFTGDMETGGEADMMAAGANVQADVLKIGHHGSSTSTGDAFLAAVNPSVALISVDEDNEYGHPHKETMEKLQKANIKTYITRDVGSIVITSDGKTIKVTTEK